MMDERTIEPGGMIDGRFSVVRRRGAGQTAVVYECRDLKRRDKLVAVKVLKSDVALDPAFQDRFRNEAQIVGNVASSHIVHVEHFDTYFVTERQEVFYYATALAKRDFAEALRDAWDHGRPPCTGWVLHVVDQVASALDAACAADVAHGDVKPGNILLFSDPDHHRPHAELADFGVARDLALATSHDEPVCLTAAYAPPEQWKGTVSHAGDQYALACTLYQALCGETPFAGRRDLRRAHAREARPWISRRSDGRLPTGLDAVFGKALAKDPTERYGSCAEFVRETRQLVDAYERELAETRRLASSDEAPTRRTPRRGRPILAISAVAAAAIAGVLLVGSGGDDPATVTSAPAAASAPQRGSSAEAPAYEDAAMEDLRERIPYRPDADGEPCSPTQFDRTAMKVRPVGIQAAYTCDTPRGVDQIAFFQRYRTAERLDAAFDQLARAASFASRAGAEQVPCEDGDASGVRQWRLGRYVCLSSRRKRPAEHWIVLSAVRARLLLAVVDVEALDSAVDEWIDVRPQPFARPRTTSP